jgi:hypothetical protein
MPLEAVRQALPAAVQVGDRWQLWHGLAGAVLKEVAARSCCWAAAGPPLKQGKQARTTAERWRQVHDLVDRGTGLLEWSRRLGLSLNTVKRYARAAEPERMIRAPKYRATLVDPYRDHLRARRAADPAVPVQTLLVEIRELGYTGSMNLLYRYITQGRVEADRPHLSPRRVCRLVLTRPDALSDDQRALLGKLTTACPQMTELAELVRCFAALLTPDAANQAKLGEWIQAAKAATSRTSSLSPAASASTSMTQSTPAATADFSPRGESSTTSVSSLVAPKRFKPVRYGSGWGLARS